MQLINMILLFVFNDSYVYSRAFIIHTSFGENGDTR